MHTISLTLFILEIIGTIAFAISGAVKGIRKGLDVLGIFALAAITATGGGIIRDITLGLTPPSVFVNPTYLNIALLSCALTAAGFLLWKKLAHLTRLMPFRLLETTIEISDAIGLGVFTVSGAAVAINNGFGNNLFLIVFVAMATGVGGGLLRDVISMEIPSIFVRHIYAIASMAGAITFYLLLEITSKPVAMIIGTAVVVTVRLISAYFQLGLPKIRV